MQILLLSAHAFCLRIAIRHSMRMVYSFIILATIKMHIPEINPLNNSNLTILWEFPIRMKSTKTFGVRIVAGNTETSVCL